MGKNELKRFDIPEGDLGTNLRFSSPSLFEESSITFSPILPQLHPL